MTKPKGHVHAALMAEYAKDAAESTDPWKLWEVDGPYTSTWAPLPNQPLWNLGSKYRRTHVPVVEHRYTNLYTGGYTFGGVFNTFDQARDNHGHSRVGIIKITYTDGVPTSSEIVYKSVHSSVKSQSKELKSTFRFNFSLINNCYFVTVLDSGFAGEEL